MYIYSAHLLTPVQPPQLNKTNMPVSWVVSGVSQPHCPPPLRYWTKLGLDRAQVDWAEVVAGSRMPRVRG